MVTTMVTAVILNYYKERAEYLPLIVDALYNGSVRPTKVIVWDNTDEGMDKGASLIHLYNPFTMQVEIISSCKNVGCLGRYLVSYGVETSYCLFVDNDILPGPNLLYNLLDQMEKDKYIQICGIIGRHITSTDSPYLNSIIVPGYSDIIVGRTSLIRTKTARSVPPYAFASGHMYDMFRCDDIIASSFIHSRRAKFAIPATDGKDYKSLDEKGIGLSQTYSHYVERDNVTHSLMKKTGAFQS